MLLTAFVQYIVLVKWCLSFPHAPATKYARSNVLDRQLNPYNPFSPRVNPDLQINAKWLDQRLSPWAAYLTTVDLMHWLAIHNWSDPLDQAYVVEDPRRLVTILAGDNTLKKQRLTFEDTIRVLYEVVHSMVTREPGFRSVSVSISKSGRRLGIIGIASRWKPPGTTIDQASEIFPVATPRSSETFVLGGNITQDLNSSVVVDPIGVITDPVNKWFQIQYTLDGNQVPYQDLFFAFFDGFARTAQLDKNKPLSHLTAASVSGNVVIHIGESGDPGTILKLNQIQQALWILFAVFYTPGKRLEDMSFSVTCYGKRYAAGYVMNIPSVGARNGTGPTDIA